MADHIGYIYILTNPSFLDINDRYAFNTIDNYYSSVENIEKIADIIETLANGKIQEFVEKGELVYE